VVRFVEAVEQLLEAGRVQTKLVEPEAGGRQVG